MDRSRYRAAASTLAACAIILVTAFSPIPAGDTQTSLSPAPGSPSVLLITLDTARADHVGCYGYSAIHTPAIDSLASGGLRFENAYAQAPITLPSHAVILTGTFPMANGVRDFTSSGLPEDVPTLAEILRRKGYRTAAFISSFVLNSMWGLNRGFEVYDDNMGFDSGAGVNPMQVERRGDQTVDRMLAWMSSEGKQPFFVWLHLYDPHSPYRPPEPFRSRYAGHPYDGEIAFDDAQVARVTSRLRELELYDHTLVALVGDHGESLGEHGEAEHGFFIYSATLRIPLILKLPGRGQSAQVVSAAVGTVDIAPTIAQACGVEAEETRSFQGRSLLRWIDEAGAVRDSAVYAESFYPRNSFGWHELRALVTPEYEYIDAPHPELYDLRRDPRERTNLAAAHSALAASLRQKLSGFDTKFDNRDRTSATRPLDPETLEKLKSLGYLSYQAGPVTSAAEADRADPKDKISTLNRILRAADLTRQANYAGADRLLGGLEQSEPALHVLPFERGENFLAWQKPQAALEEFRKALSLDPTFDQAALGLGRAHFLLGQDEQAAQALDLALDFNPRNFLARLALAKVYWRESRLEKAESAIAQVLTEHPEFPEAHADHGIILAKMGKYPQAKEEIDRGVEMGFKDAIAYNYLGVAYAETGDSAGAIRAYEEALALNPRYAAAYLNLALEYRKQGQPAKAQGYYRKACALSGELCREYAPQFSAH